MQAEFAIIGGTGVYDPALLESSSKVSVETAFGLAEATVGVYQGKRIAFMPRHGYGHTVPPHKINYRANIQALKQLGVKQILATAAVGSLQPQFEPGSLVVIDDFLDFTKARPTTFFEHDGVVHVDVTDPYCSRLRQSLVAAAGSLTIPVHASGTYVCTEGPRFESPAEIRFYQSLGAAVVGMTSIPEVVLAREAEMCYATVCMVTNYGAGISPTPLTHEEVVAGMNANVHLIRQLFFAAIDQLPSDPACTCQVAVGGQTPLVGDDGTHPPA